MLEAVAETLVEQGHEVTVLCGAGHYCPEQGVSRSDTSDDTGGDDPSSVRVIRLGVTSFGRRSFAGKAVDYGSFYLGVALWLLVPWNRFDRVVALTTPPYLSLLARGLTKFKGADHGHWVMDLYPDVMVAHGMIGEGGWTNRFLRWLTRWGFGGRRCSGVVTLGPDMEDRVRRYLSSGRRVDWIPLWGSEPAAEICRGTGRELRIQRGWRDDELVVMYSGNMGLGHRFDEILEVIRRQQEEGPQGRIRFVFYGGGKRRVELETFRKNYPEVTLELHDYVGEEVLQEHLRSADVHLVSLNSAWDGAMVPSKLQGIFSVGGPVVFVGSETCSIGQWIKESGGGWVVAPGDVEGLEQAIKEASDPAELPNAASGGGCGHFLRSHVW